MDPKNYVKARSMFSFRSFMVSSLIFRSLIHFEFIFVYGIRECSNFILLHVAVQFSQYYLLKRQEYTTEKRQSLQYSRIYNGEKTTGTTGELYVKE